MSTARHGQRPAHAAKSLRASPALWLALSILLATNAACSDVAAPDPLERRAFEAAQVFALQSVSGKPLPAVAVEHEHLRLTLIADTLWLFTNGKGEQRTIEHTVSSTSLPPGDGTYDRRHAFTYRIEGGRFTAEFACPDFASCVAPPHWVGTLDDGVLTLAQALYLRTPLTYSRVP